MAAGRVTQIALLRGGYGQTGAPVGLWKPRAIDPTPVEIDAKSKLGQSFVFVTQPSHMERLCIRNFHKSEISHCVFIVLNSLAKVLLAHCSRK